MQSLKFVHMNIYYLIETHSYMAENWTPQKPTIENYKDC